jgi:2-dehydro-3-deoxyphosphogluconate aldolase/(4S)-4-hydroxy-2-oxoglutarate aldolase
VVAQPSDAPLSGSDPVDAARGGPIADAIRDERLIVVLRRVEPRERLVGLVLELADAGARIFEITLDGPSAPDDIRACRDALAERKPGSPAFVGAGTIRERAQVALAVAAEAAFGVAPVLDSDVLAAALDAGLPFVPGAFTPTEVDRAWRLGATFVKIFPGSAVGPTFVRELRGPLPEVETIVTGGVDASNAGAFLEAGAAAVGIGSALVRATASGRRAILEGVRGSRAT